MDKQGPVTTVCHILFFLLNRTVNLQSIKIGIHRKPLVTGRETIQGCFTTPVLSAFSSQSDGND